MIYFDFFHESFIDFCKNSTSSDGFLDDSHRLLTVFNAAKTKKESSISRQQRIFLLGREEICRCRAERRSVNLVNKPGRLTRAL